MSEQLLTPEEQKPFLQSARVGYGDIEVDEEHWDIDGLLKAQHAKSLKLKMDEEEELQQEQQELRNLNENLDRELPPLSGKTRNFVLNHLDSPQLRKKIDSLIGEIISVTELTILNKRTLTDRLNILNNLRAGKADQIIDIIKGEKRTS